MQIIKLPPRSLMEPKIIVSVVVPAYNAERWLAATLAAAASQTLREIEILVVDDGSTDRTPEIVMEHARRDPRVRLIQRKNGGVGAARNSGILEARGKYVAPLDSDDLWYPEKLELQVACMEAGGEQMGFAYCWSEKIDVSGRLLTPCIPYEIAGRVYRSLILRNFVGSGSVPLFRAKALETTGLYLDRVGQRGEEGCEDWDLLLRLAEHYDIGVVPRSLIGYRQVPACMSLNARGMSVSYEVVMERAKARSPEIPRRVFRWSGGNFYSYLVSKCYLADDYPSCLRSILKAVTADPMLLANRRFYMMGLKSLIRLATGGRSRKQTTAGKAIRGSGEVPAAKPKPSWMDIVQANRSQVILEADQMIGRT